jgi:hypothetical protein
MLGPIGNSLYCAVDPPPSRHPARSCSPGSAVRFGGTARSPSALRSRTSRHGDAIQGAPRAKVGQQSAEEQRRLAAGHKS